MTQTSRKVPSDNTLRDLVNQGMTNRELMERYNCSKTTIEAHLKRIGIRRDIQNGYVPTNDEIVDCLKQNMTLAAIAKKYGCSVDPITRRISKHNLRRGIGYQPVAITRGPRPSAVKHINTLGISVPRIAIIHGEFHP